jgi:hypothetical protein
VIVKRPAPIHRRLAHASNENRRLVAGDATLLKIQKITVLLRFWYWVRPHLFPKKKD